MPLNTHLHVMPTYTMDIETDTVRTHPFHLGTDHGIAESFVLEALGRPGVRSIALRLDGSLIHIYDYRDLEEASQ